MPTPDTDLLPLPPAPDAPPPAPLGPLLPGSGGGLLPPWPAPGGDRAAALEEMRERIADFVGSAETLLRARHYADQLVARALRRLDRSGRLAAQVAADPVLRLMPGCSEADLRKEAERRFRRAANDRAKTQFNLPRLFGPAPRIQFVAPAGSGKTKAVADALHARPWLARHAIVWIVEPSLEMGAQLEADLAALGVAATVIRGRSAPHPDEPDQRKPKRRMCERWELARAVSAAGVSVQKTLCAAKEQRCPFFDQCAADGYQAQRAGGPGVYILAHQYLGLSSAPAPRPDLVFVDERHWPVLCHVDDGLHPDRLHQTPAEMTWMRVGFDALSRYRRTADAVADALRASGGRKILAALRTQGITRDDLKHGAALLAQLETDDNTGITPTMEDRDIVAHLAALTRAEISALGRLFRALADEIDLPRDEANGVIYDPNASVMVGGGSERQERVFVRRLRAAKIAAETPVLLIDASADLEINRRIWGERLEDAGIRIERHARVTQLTRKLFSRSRLLGYSGHGEAEADVAKRTAEAVQAQQQVAAFVAEAAHRAGGPALLVSYKKAEEPFSQLLAGKPVAVAHFGAVRGRNDWKDCAAVIVVGREQPRPHAVEALARALYAKDPEPFVVLGDYVDQMRPLRLADGKAHYEVVKVHPDPRCQRVLEQLREREIEQAVDRARLIHNPAPKSVFLLTNIPCDITIDRVVSWPELRAGGSRLERAFSRTGGVLPLSYAELARVFPDLWRSAKAAEGDLARDPENTPAAQIRTLFGDRGYFRLRYRRPGQRGKASPAVVPLDVPDPVRALFDVVGLVDMLEPAPQVVPLRLAFPSVEIMNAWARVLPLGTVLSIAASSDMKQAA